MARKKFLHLARGKLKSDEPLVSVIVPAYNEEEVIGACIASLKEQSYPHIEIIFVDDGSTDKTLEIVRRFKDVRIFEQDHGGPGNARNLGSREARGEILSFVDADMTFDVDFIRNLIEPIVHEGEIGTIDGVQIALNQDNIWSRCWGRYFVKRKSDYGWVYRAMLKSEFERMGGFDPKYGYADDRTFFIKYGARSKRVKGARCYHKNAESLSEVFKQSVWIGSSVNSRWVEVPLVNLGVLIVLFLGYPLAVPLLSIQKSHKIKNFEIFFPWMLIFMSVRYAGMLKGVYRRIFFGLNVR